MMQKPTHPFLQIRNAHEAHIVMEAVRLGQLPLIQRRLSTKERQELIKEGAVFVWEESDYRGGVDRGGIERWTDGCKWSQSRMHEPFLLYEEKAEVPKDETEKLSGDKKGDAASRARRQNRPNKPNGLTKQTYSALLHLPNAEPGTKPSKWHLTCYFRRPGHLDLPGFESDELLKKIAPAEGVFVTAKGLTRRKSSAVSLDPREDALARLHPGGNVGLNGSTISLRGSNGSVAESESEASISPTVSTSPQSPYGLRYPTHTAWSPTSSVTANSPLTPPAAYGAPHSPNAPPPHYPPPIPTQHQQYHYPPSVHHYMRAAIPASPNSTGAPPNGNYHFFPGSLESHTLAPIRPPVNPEQPRLPSVSAHWTSDPNIRHAPNVGLGMMSPHTNSVTYGNDPHVMGSNANVYDSRHGQGCYVDPALGGRTPYHEEQRWMGMGVTVKEE